jgi:hypothetical protein
VSVISCRFRSRRYGGGLGGMSTDSLPETN